MENRFDPPAGRPGGNGGSHHAGEHMQDRPDAGYQPGAPGVTAASRESGLSTAEGRMRGELRNVLRDVEDFLKRVTNISGGDLAAARDQVQQKLTAASAQLDQATASARQTTRQAAVAADDYVRAQPWTAVSAAAVAGIIIGILMSRR